MNTAFTRSEQMRIDPALRAGQKSRDPDAIELRGLLRLFARRWKLIFGAAIVAAVCVYLAVAQMTPATIPYANLNMSTCLAACCLSQIGATIGY